MKRGERLVTAEYALDDIIAPPSGDGASITPFATKKRAPEWGVRAIIIGDGAYLTPWVRDLGRRAVTVECVGFAHVKTVEDAIAQLTGFRAAVVILAGPRASAFAESIIDCRPNVAVVAVLPAADLANDEDAATESISDAATPRELIHAVRRAMRMAQMRAKLDDVATLAERQRLELERLNDGIRTSLVKRHQAMCETKQYWERTFDAVDTPLAVVGDDLVVLNANRAYAAAAKVPVSHVPGKRCHSVLFGRGSACVGCPIVAQSHARDGQPIALSTQRVEVNDNAGTAFELVATPLDEQAGTYVCTYRDLTKEREKFEDRIRAERMAALGEMSAGLAHELNNPIGGILAMAQAMSRDPDVVSNAELSLDLKDIEDAAKRSRTILQALLRYARGSDNDESEAVNIAEGIADALVVVKADFRAAKIVVDLTAEPGANLVSGNPSSFQEAMVHLLRNAADAVTPQTSTATPLLPSTPPAPVERELANSAPVEKELANSTPDAPPKITIRTLSQGNEVWVEVADNGRGLPSLQDESLFVPFVSDDGRAVGKGIGLALVSRLIDNNMGRVELHRHSGGGTTVRLRLRAIH